MHDYSTSECTKWEAVLAGGNELSGNLNPLIGLAVDGVTQWNEDLCTWSRTKHGCQQDCERMRILGPTLATY